MAQDCAQHRHYNITQTAQVQGVVGDAATYGVGGQTNQLGNKHKDRNRHKKRHNQNT